MAKSVTYSKTVADAICSRMADEGMTLKEICQQEDMPSMATVRRWRTDDVNGFRAEFDTAIRIKYETWEDECVQIADDSRNDYIERENKVGGIEEVLNPENINRSKLRIQTRQTFMRARRPELYSEKQTMELTGKNGGAIAIENMSDLDLARRILFSVRMNKRALTQEPEQGQLGEAAAQTAELPAPPAADV